jgi:sterol desaturase/sphingolipid hydroxylase (fatty acid hydroxylase superfamily)
MTKGKYFGGVPDWVDTKKAPGMSSVPKTTPLAFLRDIPFNLISTPNGTWAAIALICYFLFPYDLSKSSAAALGPVTWAFFRLRFPFWFGLTMGYISFWHVTLYFLNWGKRPFIQDRKYNVDKVLHNATWTLSGIILWTCTENIVAYLWASGRLPYLTDAETFSSLSGILKFAVALLLVPAYRAVHFYTVHRMLHFAPMYYFVHSLHHRNTDIEPFSGTCMHPIEHLYYYSCYLGSLLFVCNPFAFFWIGVHLLLSPGASHSGWEDHFQGDLYHYIHHRYFECNYSQGDFLFVDEFFGTCVRTMADRDKSGVKARSDAKSTLRSAPTFEFVAYLAMVLACFIFWGYQATQVHQGVVLTFNSAVVVALIGGAGPLVAAVVYWLLIGSPNNNGGAMSIAWLVVLLSMAMAICVFPVVYMCFLAVRPLV